jgi:hypothetical protein
LTKDICDVLNICFRAFSAHIISHTPGTIEKIGYQHHHKLEDNMSCCSITTT